MNPLRVDRRRRLQRIEHALLGPVYRRIQLYIRRNPYIHGDPGRLALGEGVRLVDAIVNVSSGTVTIGDRTIFGHGCMLLTGRHTFGADGREAGVPDSGFDITIGADCWIASGSIVLGGVSIGDRVTVAAGAIVTRDVPSGSTVAGVPARPV